MLKTVTSDVEGPPEATPRERAHAAALKRARVGQDHVGRNDDRDDLLAIPGFLKRTPVSPTD